jgi:hypothetical protein
VTVVLVVKKTAFSATMRKGFNFMLESLIGSFPIESVVFLEKNELIFYTQMLCTSKNV